MKQNVKVIFRVDSGIGDEKGHLEASGERELTNTTGKVQLDRWRQVSRDKGRYRHAQLY